MKYIANLTSNLKINTLLLILFTLLTNTGNTSAQNTKPNHKNTAYVSLGSILFDSQFSISYERLIFEKKKMETSLKANYGNYFINGSDYETNARVNESFFSLSAVQLIGLLELNAGIAYTQYKLARGFDPEPDIDYTELKNRVNFYGIIGIRYTKNRFLIRGGLGNLELLHLGVGLKF